MTFLIKYTSEKKKAVEQINQNNHYKEFNSPNKSGNGNDSCQN